MRNKIFQTTRTVTRIIFMFGLILTLNISLFSQPDYKLIEEKEDEIKEVFDSLFYRNEIRFLRNDSQKQHLNDTLLGLFRDVLSLEGSFDYPFNKLLHCGVLRSPDNRFKLYNWNLRFSDGSYKYYCFIQNYDNKKDIVYTWELYDDSDSILTPEKLVLNDKHWYGALYYYILPYMERKKTNYILLGWDGNNNFTNKKIVEQLSFTSEGAPRFGKSVFKFDEKTLKRFIIEYSIRVSLTLVYDEKADAIVWDHLAPEDASKTGDLYYYGPDASYDGFRLEKGKWVYVPDIYVTNIQSVKKVEIYPNPADNEIHVKVKGEISDEYTITLYDTENKLIRNITTKDAESIIDISQLPAGVYLLNVNGKDISRYERIIKK